MMTPGDDNRAGSGPRTADGAAPAWRRGWWIAIPGIVILLACAAAVVVWRLRPHLTEREVDGVVTAAIQQEAKAAFLVTGYLDINSQARIENTLRLLPGILNLSMGSTTVSVRAPGRVHYGFEASQINPDRIRLAPDGVVEVDVPQPAVYTVSPDLEHMDIETAVGWTRLTGNSRAEVQARALALVQENMKQQAMMHMRTSKQPGINSADALYTLLKPVLIAAGMKDPKFRFRIGNELVMEPRAR
jgi:hypothetical protein